VAKIYRRPLLMLFTIVLLITAHGATKVAAAEAPSPYLGNMLLSQAAPGVEIVSTKISITITGAKALLTCDYQITNRGSDQTISAVYPTSGDQEEPLITGFAASKNGQPLTVKERYLTKPAGGIPTSLPAWYYGFNFPVASGETCTVRNSYFAELPTDATQGRLLHYDTHTQGGWDDMNLKKIDISITDFKPYFNIMLFPEQGAAPQTMDYRGNFSYLIDPQVRRQDVYLYYQLRGPEAALQRLAMSSYGKSLVPVITSGNYAIAAGQLQLLSSTLMSEAVLSPQDLTMLKLYLAYQQKDYGLAAEELKRMSIQDGAYIYYHILNSLQLKEESAAGQSLRQIGQFEQQDLTGVSVGLLKTWSEKTISQYLARPAAPVPPTTTTKPQQHTAVLFLTMGLVVVASITATVLMRRNDQS